MKKILAACLALLLLYAGAAMAEVVTTGNVNLREGPGLEYDTLITVPSGTELFFCDDIRTDDRGVDWYSVDYKDYSGWVSSKYAELVNEPQPVAFDLTDLDSFVEVSGYYLANLDDAAEALGLEDYREVNSEAPRRFSNDALTLGGDFDAEFFDLTGGGYTLFGAAPGMTLEEVRQKLEAAGLERFSDACYQHPAGPNSHANVDGMDSCINLWTRGDIVIELDWSTYTG